MPNAARATRPLNLRTSFKSVDRRIEFMSTRAEVGEVPQGLKPVPVSASSGTAEAVPFHGASVAVVSFPKPAAAALPSSDSSKSADDDQATDIKQVVKQKYGEAALRVKSGGSSCCGATASTGCCDPITTNLYDAAQAGQIPEEALLASLGCGNPTALAQLKLGETVLDLGSGGGIDVLLSVRRVGPTGKAYGLDMTDEMLALANDNKRKAGIENVEFLKGEIESIPLPDNSVDVIISNCVINLSADKGRVLREAFRVLRPGGRFAVSDVVVRGSVPDSVRKSMLLWVGCIAGALEEQDYRSKLIAAGFEDVSFEPTRIYNIEDARRFLTGEGIDVDAIAPLVENKFMSAFIRAVKPAPKECCGPACCN